MSRPAIELSDLPEKYRIQAAKQLKLQPKASAPKPITVSVQPESSAIEQEMAAMLDDLGIAYDREQCLIDGRDFRCDFVMRDAAVVIECEGVTKGAKNAGHQTIEGVGANCEKSNLLQLHGWMVLRFTGRQIRNEKEKVRGIVSQAMGCAKVRETWK